VIGALPLRRSDDDLAARLVAGDPDALREAYRTYAPAVFGLALRILHDNTLAEDVTQDVFVRLWTQPHRYDPIRGPLRSFLLAITHSRAVERIRSEESQRRRADAVARLAAHNVLDDPATVVSASRDGVAVRRALAELPEDQRSAIELAYFEGLSYREVADRLDEPEGTVKYRIRAGMRKMKAAIQADEVTP
jgi:RNA polymerase sigma-70 factor (ECF subfamily)